MLTHDQIEELGAIRGQFVARCLIDEQSCGLMYDMNPCRLDQLAQSLKTDDWNDFCEGKFEVFYNGRVLVKYADICDWTIGTTIFVRVVDKYVCKTCGIPVQRWSTKTGWKHCNSWRTKKKCCNNIKPMKVKKK